MTATLLRHEFLRTRKPLGVALAAGAGVTLVAWLLIRTEVEALALLGSGIAFAAPWAFLGAIECLLAADYWRMGYGRQGYFTQTLPLAGGTIFRAKFLYGAAVSTLACLLCLLFAAVPMTADGTLSRSLRDADARGLLNPGLILLALAGLVVTSWYFLAQLYFAASLGAEGRLGSLGIGGPVLVFFLLYVAIQLFTAAALFAVPFTLTLADGDLAVQHLTLAMSGGGQGVDGLPLGVVVSLLVPLPLLLARTHHSWQRKVSLR